MTQHRYQWIILSILLVTAVPGCTLLSGFRKTFCDRPDAECVDKEQPIDAEKGELITIDTKKDRPDKSPRGKISKNNHEQYQSGGDDRVNELLLPDQIDGPPKLPDDIDPDAIILPIPESDAKGARKSDYPAKDVLDPSPWTDREPGPFLKRVSDVRIKSPSPESVKELGPLLAAPARQEPVLVALDLFLHNKPQQALKHLEVYDRASQDVIVRMFPVLVQLTKKKVAELNSEELAALYEQLDSVMKEVLWKTELVIDEMCYCEEVQSYGVYQALPETHAFRPKSGQMLGDLVQIYVQLPNLCSEKRGQFYETRVSSSVEIADNEGRQWWYYNFRDEEPIRSQTMRRDQFLNYSFYVPRIPPGQYTLTIQVKDVTKPDVQRIARRSLEFHVSE